MFYYVYFTATPPPIKKQSKQQLCQELIFWGTLKGRTNFSIYFPIVLEKENFKIMQLQINKNNYTLKYLLYFNLSI